VEVVAIILASAMGLGLLAVILGAFGFTVTVTVTDEEPPKRPQGVTIDGEVIRRALRRGDERG
jgi:hypothetical protein